MFIIPTEENTSTVTDMRVNADGLIKDVEKTGMKYIFQKSKPKAVLLNMKLFKRLVEAFEDWEDQQRVYEIEHEDPGVGVSLVDAAEELGVKLHRQVHQRRKKAI